MLVVPLLLKGELKDLLKDCELPKEDTDMIEFPFPAPPVGVK